MQSIMEWVVLFFSTAINYFLQGVIVLLILNRKLRWKELAFFALINALGREILIPLPEEYLVIKNLIIYIVIMLLTFKYIFKIDFLRSALSTCMLILLSGIIEYTNMAILKLSFSEYLISGTWFQTITNKLLLYAAMRNVANLLLFTAATLIYYFKMKIYIPEDINKRRTFSIIINGLLASIMIIPNMLFFINNTVITVPTEIIIFNAMSVLILLSLSIYNSINFGELEAKRQEVEFQKLYIQTLSDTIDGLRGFKHDFNNIIQVISGYLSLDDLSGLKKYFSQLQGDIRMINNMLPLNTFIKDNPAVYGLLLSKISYAEIKNIVFNVNISAKINTGSMKIYDFCKVLGILLDNALEAASESEKKYAELMITEKPDKTGLVIDITNSFAGHVDIEKIYENGFSTKSDHSGFGLWEVKKILSKHKNCCLKTTVADNIFMQHLEILY